MKYIKSFETQSVYNSVKDSLDTPNISLIKETMKCEFNPYVPPPAEATMVDLGLPSGLKWAKANLGANEETDAGLYYAWGETTGYAKGSGHSFSSGGYTYITSDLTPEQDAANVRLGKSWRMPTKTELDELYSYTDKSWVTINNINGYKLANKTDASKYIFLPAIGYYDGTTLRYNKAQGIYLSSTFYSPYSFYCMSINPSKLYVNGGSAAYLGYSIRAVHP